MPLRHPVNSIFIYIKLSWPAWNESEASCGWRLRLWCCPLPCWGCCLTDLCPPGSSTLCFLPYWFPILSCRWALSLCVVLPLFWAPVYFTDSKSEFILNAGSCPWRVRSSYEQIQILQGLSGSCVDHRLEGLWIVAGKPTNQVLMPGLQMKSHSAVARTDQDVLWK